MAPPQREWVTPVTGLQRAPQPHPDLLKELLQVGGGETAPASGRPRADAEARQQALERVGNLVGGAGHAGKIPTR
jgi:hypothetical protein